MGLAAATIPMAVGGEAAQPSVRNASVTAEDSVYPTRAVLAINEFFVEWQRLWRGSALLRNGVAVDDEIRTIRLASSALSSWCAAGILVAGSATGANWAIRTQVRAVRSLEVDPRRSPHLPSVSWVRMCSMPMPRMRRSPLMAP